MAITNTDTNKTVVSHEWSARIEINVLDAVDTNPTIRFHRGLSKSVDETVISTLNAGQYFSAFVDYNTLAADSRVIDLATTHNVSLSNVFAFIAAVGDLLANDQRPS